MLYWICPECGHECSPAIRECPTCTSSTENASRDTAVREAAQAPVQQPPPRRTAVANELLSLAETFQSGPSVALLAPAPQRQLLVAGTGREGQAATVALQEPVAVQPKEPELSHKLAPLDSLVVTPACLARSKPIKLSPSPVPARISSPAVSASTAAPSVEFGLSPAGPAPAGEVSFQAAPGGKPATPKQLLEPLPSRRQAIAFIRAELPGNASSGLALAELEELKLVIPHQNGLRVNHEDPFSPIDYQPGGPALVFARIDLTGESLVELRNALEVSAEELEQAAISSIQASFVRQPVAALLSAPTEIVTAPAPPAEQWIRSPKPKFTATAPETSGRASLIAGPQAPPLAGPSLPPQLRNFTEHQNSTLRPVRKRVAAPTWMVSLLVATVLFLGAGSLLQYLTSDRDAKAASVTTPAQAAQAAPTPAPAAPVVQEHPAAKSVEVAGVRIIAGPNKKPQLQYIVINHSANELTGLNIRIAVRSADTVGGPALFNISSVVATLGPNQSKELRTELDPSVKPSSIPDWTALRTEVLIAKQ